MNICKSLSILIPVLILLALIPVATFGEETLAPNGSVSGVENTMSAVVEQNTTQVLTDTNVSNGVNITPEPPNGSPIVAANSSN